jgi:hypothetical protein
MSDFDQMHPRVKGQVIRSYLISYTFSGSKRLRSKGSVNLGRLLLQITLVPFSDCIQT